MKKTEYDMPSPIAVIIFACSPLIIILVFTALSALLSDKIDDNINKALSDLHLSDIPRQDNISFSHVFDEDEVTLGARSPDNPPVIVETDIVSMSLVGFTGGGHILSPVNINYDITYIDDAGKERAMPLKSPHIHYFQEDGLSPKLVYNTTNIQNIERRPHIWLNKDDFNDLMNGVDIENLANESGK